MVTTVTRFAPSPTGRLHLGHAYSALVAEAEARRDGGRFLLRIEDIDTTRCRPHFATAIGDDLAWLGLSWETPVRYQSAHLEDYAAALAHLEQRSLIYPCFCTRSEIQREIAARNRAPHGPEGPIYPGLCRHLSAAQCAARQAAGEPYALRLDMAAAIASLPPGSLTWYDRRQGWQSAQPELFGDVVLARKDTPTSYHLAVTVDDHLQGVTLVTRGEDLFAATHIHRLLQALLELSTPEYLHHPLLHDATGRRLAKRDKAQTLAALRAAGVTPEDLRDEVRRLSSVR